MCQGFLCFIFWNGSRSQSEKRYLSEERTELSQTTGKATISPEHISGQGGPAFPYLSVPMNISLRSAETQNRMGAGIYIPTGDDPIQDYTLHQIYGVLIFNFGGSSSGQVAFHSFPLSFFSRPDIEGTVVLNIPLTVYQLQQIEGQRTGDVSLKFDFTFEFAKHYPIPRKQPSSPIEQFETNFFSMTVNVPRSIWIDRVLPGLGYGKIHLVEVPTPEKAIGETIARAVEDFQHAQEQMLQGEYNNVLGYCRDALERLSNAIRYGGEKETPSFAEKIDYLLTVLPGTPTGARRTHLARLLKDLYGLTSMPEHPSPPHFTRDDAEMAILNTIAVLSYMGKFLSREREASQAGVRESMVATS
jgi:hypothetical protein